MNREMGYIADKVIKNKEHLSKSVKKLKKEEYGKEALFTADWAALFSFIGESLSGDESAAEKVKKWADREAENKVTKDAELDQSLRTIHYVRRSLWEVFAEELEEDAFSSRTIIEVCKTINLLLDDISNRFCKTYSESIRIESERRDTRLAELSVPVVPITEGVAVLPLVGEIDTPRAQLIMETSLSQSTELDLDYLFIDVSGVPLIDTYIATYIYQVVHALELVGVHVTLTGLRPETAKAVVDLGVDFKRIHTKSGLHQALKEIGVYIHIES
ncbi:STAS domain-containing protein [Halobacillus litoralis]|uniref:STAS domain-containing protein n=1 Tax=Halobacillus litoralis TaxID=45668 RepID=UPI001CFE1534|nr:STAS domain-containing protein [Halobacillus litoralis]